MTRTKIINQIRKCLEEEKTIKDKISTLTFIKIMVEADLERLKKENDKQQMAYRRAILFAGEHESRGARALVDPARDQFDHRADK